MIPRVQGENQELLVTGSDKLLPFAIETKGLTDTFEDADNSDHASFKHVNVPVLFFTRGEDKDYHSPSDSDVNPQLLDEVICSGLSIVEILSSVQD